MRAADSTQRVPGLGVVALRTLLGKPWGSPIQVGPTRYAALPPRLADHLKLLDRKAQIILPKDAARIVFEAGLRSGSRVAEAGVGSGALTLALAYFVGPAGRVYAYDVRQDHLDVGRRNVARAGLEDVVEFRLGDVTKEVVEHDLDAFVLDVPEPEAAVAAAQTHLRPGGVFAAYTPLVVQMERAALALRARGFVEVRSLETLERGWTVHDRGSRPDTNMLAHTGFLTFARRP